MESKKRRSAATYVSSELTRGNKKTKMIAYRRAKRGWKFQAGVDDAESECGLDDYRPYDFLIDNEPENAVSEESITEISLTDGTQEKTRQTLEKIARVATTALQS